MYKWKLSVNVWKIKHLFWRFDLLDKLTSYTHFTDQSYTPKLYSVYKKSTGAVHILHTVESICVYNKADDSLSAESLLELAAGCVVAWHHHGTGTTAAFSTSELCSSQTDWNQTSTTTYHGQLDGLVFILYRENNLRARERRLPYGIRQHQWRRGRGKEAPPPKS